MSKTYDIPTIVVEVSGGLITGVTADSDVNARVIIVDNDNPSIDEPEIIEDADAVAALVREGEK